ncbi:hypothetical protein ACGFXC_05540 [Streptomyces sp. NPDC048507]|uniref:hypothetical protein n=1 Tax=Streptomyces sp. NPDC048507 TaxID=3365560 RepID=UPI003717F727
MSARQPHPRTHRAERPSGRGAFAAGALLVAALLALPLGPATGARAAEASGTSPRTGAAALAAGSVTVTEGRIGEAGPGGVLTYPSVTSCLTVTVRLRDGGLAGAHASLFQVPGELRSDAILAALRDRVGDRPVTAIEVRGAVGAWDPSYFTKAIEAYGENEPVPVPEGRDFDGLAAAVAAGLGRPRALVTVEDVPDGDQTVG